MSRDGFPYQPYYCEENVWHLANASAFADRDRRVLFVSNERRQVALWCQRASPDPEQPIVWDYHVLFVVREDDGWHVYDHDSTLAFGVLLDDYAAATFRYLVEPYAPRFFVVPGQEYAAVLSSDRSHMRDEHGAWLKPPPPWPPPLPAENGTTLETFVRAAERGLDLRRLVTDGLGSAP